MAIIENIPADMITEHVNWHMRPGNPSGGGRRIDPWPPAGGGPAPRSGAEFLNWHAGYIQRFRDWVAGLPPMDRPNPVAIQPWTNIPTGLKMGMLGWNAQLQQEEQRLRDMGNFGSLDEVGRFIEWSLHGFLHNASAGMWNEPVLRSFESPRSTFFWKLHGLVDHWRRQWVQHEQSSATGGDTAQPADSPFVTITVGAAPLSASIAQPGEVDAYRFVADTGGTYLMETHGPSDTVMYLAGPDDPQSIVAVNDDGGADFNARLAGNLPAATYYLYVVHYSETATGDYSISVRHA